MQILILGMHRSGTSITARIINMMGGYFGPERSAHGPNPDNPKGFWERRDVMHFNESLLMTQKCRWHELKNWKINTPYKPPRRLVHDMQNLIHGMDAFRPWFIKDPRLCLTLGAWLPLLEVPIGVIVSRDPVEIAKSLRRRDGMPLEYALALWECYTVSMLNRSLHVPRLFVQHADMLAAPVKTTQTLYNKLVALGVRRIEMPSSPEIRAFIDPKLYRAKAQTSDHSLLSDRHHALLDILAEKREQQGPLKVSDASMEIILAGSPCKNIPDAESTYSGEN